MERILVLTGAALSVCLTVSAPSAQHLLSMTPGTNVQGVLTLGDKQIQLPEGEWELLYSGTDRLAKISESGYAYLVQKAGDRHHAYLFARTNLTSLPSRWGRDSACGWHNVYHNGSKKVYSNTDHDCWILNHRLFLKGARGLNIDQRLTDYAIKHAGTSTFVYNWYFRVDYGDFMYVAHLVNPTAYGFCPVSEKSWKKSEWHRVGIARSMARRSFMEAMKAFGAKYRDAVRAGFLNRLEASIDGLKLEFKPLRRPRTGSPVWCRNAR